MPILFLLIILFVLLSAFFSGIETAVVSCSRIRIRHLAELGDKRAALLQQLLETPHKIVATTLVGTNLGVVGASSLATYLVIRLSSHPDPELLSTLTMVPIILVFGDILPKAFFYHRADVLVLWLANLLKGLSTVLMPVVYITSLPVTGLLKSARKIPFEGKLPLSREELQMLIEEGKRDGAITAQEARMISRTFDFRDTPVRNIMVPLASVVSLSVDSTVEQAVSVVMKSGYSRIPVFEGTPPRALGAILATDLLGLSPDEPIKSLIRPVTTTKDSTKLGHLFIQMQESQDHLLLVANKRNVPLGIVTVEDIVEEIIGEIKDEFDR